MKKIISLALLAGLSNVAQAYDFGTDPSPYVGADYAPVNMNYTHEVTGDLVGDNLQGVAPYFGINLTDYFGAEFGYLQSQKTAKTNILDSGVDTETELTGYTADVTGRIPLSANQRLTLLGRAGVGKYKLKVDFIDNGHRFPDEYQDLGLRLGAGLQYQFTNNLGVRAMASYAAVDFESDDTNAISDGLMLFSAGLNYRF